MRGRPVLMILIAALAACLLLPGVAVAQNQAGAGAAETGPNPGSDKVDAKGVGISGGAIVGFELVAAVEALIGVEEGWAYIVFPLVGAGGGAAGGYFLEGASTGGAVAMLVCGMALVIPTALLVSSAMAYHPEDGEVIEEESYSFEIIPTTEQPMEETRTEVESRPEGVEPGALPPSDPGEPPAEEPAPAPEAPPEGAPSPGLRPVPHAAAGALLHLDRTGGAGLALPSPRIGRAVIGPEEALLGMRPGIEVHVPLLRIDLP